jgi:hypothetical protein
MQKIDELTGEARVAGADGTTRRVLLGLGARLALAGPAVLAGLHIAGTTAHADDDNLGNGNGSGNAGDRGRGRTDNQPAPANAQPIRRGGTFNSDLVPVNAVDLSDFNPGNTDTGFGSLSVGSAGTTTSSVVVSLQGATANQTYTLAFVPLSNPGARQSLGAFTTNANGNGRMSLDSVLPESGTAPDRLGTRVGVFVLRRGDINGPDAFVTAA